MCKKDQSARKQEQKKIEATGKNKVPSKTGGVAKCPGKGPPVKIELKIAEPRAVVVKRSENAAVQLEVEVQTFNADSNAPITFDGKLELAQSGSGKLIFCDSAGTALGASVSISGASLKQTTKFRVEGKEGSAAIDGLEITASLHDGKAMHTCAQSLAKKKMTVVDAKIEVHHAKPQAGIIGDGPRREPGPVVRCKNANFTHVRSQIVIRKLPHDAPYAVELSASNGNMQLFATADEKPASGQSPVALPLALAANAIPNTGYILWAQGEKVSSALQDIEFKLELKTLLNPVDIVKFTVYDLRAKDGRSPAPRLVAHENDLTKASKANLTEVLFVPNLASAGFAWSSTGANWTLSDTNKRLVKIKASATPSASVLGETLELVITPSGKPAMPKLTHAMGIVEVAFAKHAAHKPAYDKYETINGTDGNAAATTEKPGPKHDIVAVETAKTGAVDITVKGAAKEDIFVVSKNSAVAVPKVENPTAVSGKFEIDAKNVNKSETYFEARLESKTGPVVNELGVVVLKHVKYKSEFFRVKDTASAGTALSLGSITGAKLTTNAVQYYSQVVATLEVSGGTAEKNVAYDSTVGKSITNGALDLEPGKTSAEAKIIGAACVSTKTRTVYVHKLRWSYFFRANASIGDRTIKLKNYGAGYLGYVGTQSYTIADTAGNTEIITVTAVNKTTGDVTLAAALTKNYTTAANAALIWPLGGLSGNPLWVSDVGSEADLSNYVAHELGHQLAGWSDLCETKNVMFGGGTTGSFFRHRPLKKYYDAATTEIQWKVMKGR